MNLNMYRLRITGDLGFELFKDIEGYEGLYQISNYGNIISLNFNRTGKENILTNRYCNGYYRVCLYKNKRHIDIFVHRLVAEAFIPNPNKLPCVNHKDEQPSNNSVDNLEWCNVEYNNNYGNHNNRCRNSKINGKNATPIVQYDLEGNFIKEWPSINEVERILKYSSGNISKCCRNKIKTTNGYIWKYKKEID